MTATATAPPTREPTLPAPTPAPAKPRRPFRSRLLGIYAFVVYLWLFAPLAVIVLFSFNDPAGKFNTKWNEFTLDNWMHPFRKQDYAEALVQSIKVALVACAVATIFGGLMALALSRYQFRGRGFVNILIVLPLTTPEIVLGASLFTLFFDANFSMGYWTVVIAHIMFCVSFVALTVQARVRGFDWTLEDAALDLGSSPMRTFRTITFPLILPGIAAAFLLSLALSIDDYIITSFVAGNGEDAITTFPMRIFNANKTEIPPQVHVIASAIMFVSIAFITIGIVRSMRRDPEL
jgi:spermidine/putrescine transport system permease protein